MSVTTAEKLACASRELALRRNVYPKFIKAGRMSVEAAQHQIDVMAAIVADYEDKALREHGPKDPQVG